MKIYVDVTAKGVTVYASGSGDNGEWETTFVPLPSGLFDNSSDKTPLNLPKFKAASVVMIASMRKTIIRVTDFPATENQWALIRQVFPIGNGMNENTHIFDASEFVNAKGKSCFFMAALPIETGNMITKIGEALTGSIYQLESIDTAEHILFKRYTTQSGAFLILLPQDGGLRLLHIADGLPRWASDISNNPNHRESEFSRCIQNIETTTQAIFLYREYADISKWQWLHEIISASGVAIEEKQFSLKGGV